MEEDLDPTARQLVLSRFWIQRVLVPIVVLFGVGGNIISVIVLTRKRMLCTTTIFLTALAVADIVYLISVLFLSFEHYPNIHSQSYQFYWSFIAIAHFICDSASNVSVWLTVAFTMERYLVVCHPIKGKVISTERRAKVIICIITVMCVSTTFPVLFEYELDIDKKCIPVPCEENMTNTLPKIDTNHLQELRNITDRLEKLLNKNKVIEVLDDQSVEHDNHTNILVSKHFELTKKVLEPLMKNKTLPCYDISAGDDRFLVNETICKENDNFTKVNNETCCKQQYKIGAKPSSLARNDLYIVSIFWFSSLFYGLIPLVLIGTFNTFLVMAMFRSRNTRRRMTLRSRSETNSQNQENRITILLIAVVILFLVCQTPTAAFLIYDALDPQYDKVTENIKKTLGNIFNFLVNLNAALNFVVYCVFSKKYVKTFKEIFCQKKLERQDTLGISRLTTKSTNHIGPRRNNSEYVRTPRNLENRHPLYSLAKKGTRYDNLLNHNLQVPDSDNVLISTENKTIT